METYQKELLISRIASGYLRYPTKDKIIRIYSPNSDISYEANEIFSKTYIKCRNEGVMSDEDLVNMLIDYDLWSEQEEKDYKEVLPKHLDYWKEELYKAKANKGEREKIRKYLKVTRAELIRMANIRHRYEYMSCFGIAAYAKIQFIIERSSYLSSGKRYRWSDSSLHRGMTYYQEHVIREETLRELSHTNPWDNIWSASKKNGQIFNKCGVELSIDQQRLILWSAMYDNIHEQPEAPTAEVIKDDDMLDGWLSLKRKNQLGDRDSGITNPKIANANEIFMPARTLEESKEIDRFNDRAGQVIKKRTMKALDKQSEVPDIMLPHMQERLMMEATQKLSRGK